MVDWDDFKYFSAVARSGSVRGAARDLGVHPSTVTRRLENFEDKLGMRLFVRTRSGLAITPGGAEVVETLDEVAARLEEVEQRLKDRDGGMNGTVRINVPEVLRARLFMPALRKMADGQPGLTIELTCRWLLPDPLMREADLAAVITDDPPADLIGRPLGRMTLAAYGRADGERRWLTSALEREIAPEYGARLGCEGWPMAHMESLDCQLTAAVGGMGTTLLPCYLAEAHSELVPFGDDRIHRAMWLLLHPSSRGVARVQTVADILIETLRGLGLTATTN